jgi:hypothetical protein
MSESEKLKKIIIGASIGSTLFAVVVVIVVIIIVVVLNKKPAPTPVASSESVSSSIGTSVGIPAVTNYYPINFVPNSTCSTNCIIDNDVEVTIVDSTGLALTETDSSIILSANNSGTNTNQRWIMSKTQDPSNGFSAVYRIQNKATNHYLQLTDDGYFMIPANSDPTLDTQSWTLYRLGDGNNDPFGVVSVDSNGAWSRTTGSVVVMLQPDNTFSDVNFHFSFLP